MRQGVHVHVNESTSVYVSVIDTVRLSANVNVSVSADVMRDQCKPTVHVSETAHQHLVVCLCV